MDVRGAHAPRTSIFSDILRPTLSAWDEGMMKIIIEDTLLPSYKKLMFRYPYSYNIGIT